MLTSNGYCLTYYKNKNQIVICLPQTLATATNTYGQVVDRRTDVEEKDLAVLMNVTQVIFHKEMDLKDHYCDRNKCLQMEYNGKGCAECESDTYSTGHNENETVVVE